MRPLVVTLACIALGLAGVLGCPAPEPPKKPAPPAPTEAEAKAELDKAAAVGTPEALLAVHEHYPKFPSGQLAQRKAATILVDRVREQAKACDMAAARGGLAIVAPLTLDDVEINARYDETLKELDRTEAHCQTVALDRDLSQLEAKRDWSGVFDRLAAAGELGPAVLDPRRTKVAGDWRAYLDASVREVVQRKRFDGDKRAELEAAVEIAQVPSDLQAELEKWRVAVRAVVALFGEMTDGEVFPLPRNYWVYGLAHTHRLEAAHATDGPTLANGAPFSAIGRGKLGTDRLLLAGKPAKDIVARLQSSLLLIPELEAKPYDTRNTGAQ